MFFFALFNLHNNNIKIGHTVCVCVYILFNTKAIDNFQFSQGRH